MQSGERSRQRSYLPPNKQYLVTRNVPCYKRASAVEGAVEASETVVEGAPPLVAPRVPPPRADSARTTAADGVGSTGDDDVWLAPMLRADSASGADAGGGDKDIPSMDEPQQQAGAAQEESDDVPDIADFSAPVSRLAAGVAASSLEEEDECALPYLVAHEPPDNILRTRTYDVSITYDKFYQTPRIWLTGYDERRMPLSPTQALEDVSHEHARKTVTVDGHPHTGISAVSIHPCRHAAVMKTLAGACGLVTCLAWRWP